MIIESSQLTNKFATIIYGSSVVLNQSKRAEYISLAGAFASITALLEVCIACFTCDVRPTTFANLPAKGNWLMNAFGPGALRSSSMKHVMNMT